MAWRPHISHIFFCCYLVPFDAPAEADIGRSRVSYLMSFYNMVLFSPIEARFPQFKLVFSPVRVVKII